LFTRHAAMIGQGFLPKIRVLSRAIVPGSGLMPCGPWPVQAKIPSALQSRRFPTLPPSR